MSTPSVSSHDIHAHGPHPRLRPGLLAALLALGGCYEGMPDEAGDAWALEDEAQEDDGDELDVEPIAISCQPKMHVFPVADAHNIGYDHASCGTGTCQISCPDAHANSDWGGDHHGIDVFAYRGAPLVAVTDGVIRRVGVVSATSGLRVRLQDDCGWEYYYGHLDEAVVSEGQHVQAGQLIGYMGNTGTQGVHLHFNVSPDGNYSNDINPYDLLKATSPTACGGAVPPPPPEPQPEPPPGDCSSVLAPDQALLPNETVKSCNGRYTLVMQTDGNVVLYDGVTHGALWHSQTHGTAGEVAVMQSDGNFVLYDAAGNAVWHTSTHGHPGAMLRVEEDGNVKIFDGWTQIWSAR